MTKKDDIRPRRAKEAKYTAQQDKSGRAARYNNSVMDEETIRAEAGFVKRLGELRSAKGISAREMSLSLGQGAGYINNIENGKNLPSMAMFFEICEFLGVSPKEFFVYTGTKQADLFAGMLQELPPEDQALLLELARKLKRGNK